MNLSKHKSNYMQHPLRKKIKIKFCSRMLIVVFILLRWTVNIVNVWMRFTLSYLHFMLLLSSIHKYMRTLLSKRFLNYIRTWERGLANIFFPWDQILTVHGQKRIRNYLLKLHSFKSNGLFNSWKGKISYGGPKGACQKDLFPFYVIGCFRISSIRKYYL